MESEVELDVSIKGLSTIATNPEMYEEMLKLGAIDSLISLLVHLIHVYVQLVLDN